MTKEQFNQLTTDELVVYITMLEKSLESAHAFIGEITKNPIVSRYASYHASEYLAASKVERG